MQAIEPIAKFDLALSSFCLQHRFNHQVAKISRAISHTGDGHLYVVIGLMSLWVDQALGWIFVSATLCAFAIELPIYWLAKNSFKRRRPEELSHLLPTFVTPSDRYSLPSGHTAAAFLMAVMLGHFFPSLLVGVFIWASLVGISRILLGVHFFTDVVIGATLGIASAMFVLSLIGR